MTLVQIAEDHLLHQQPGEGKMISTDSKVENGCVEGNINSHFGKFSIALRHGRCRCYLLFVVETFTGIPVLTFMLQLTFLLKGPLVLAILNNRHSAPTPRRRRAGSLAWRSSPYSKSSAVKTSKQ